MAIDWTHIYKKYKGLWVGLKNDEVTVVASGKTVKDVMEKSKKKGFFDLFSVKFDLQKKDIEIKERV